MEAACSQCGRFAFRRGLCVTCYRQARQAGPVRRLRPVDEVTEDVEWMIATGETHPETVAARLGYDDVSSLYRALSRGHRKDLAAALRASHKAATDASAAS